MKLYEGKQGRWHWCPGCEDLHLVPSNKGWSFNGDVEKPTFSPSVKHTWDLRSGPRVCHYHIREGRIEYCGDCFHPMSGKTVDLPEIPESELPENWDR